MIEWEHTRPALQTLESLLTCKICHNLISEPCSLESCDHYFCRLCVQKIVGVNSKCPECGSFAWIKDLKPNRQLSNLVSQCKSMRNAIDNSVLKERTKSCERSSQKIRSEYYPNNSNFCKGRHDEWHVSQLSKKTTESNSTTSNLNFANCAKMINDSIFDESYNSICSNESVLDLSNFSEELLSSGPFEPKGTVTQSNNDYKREITDLCDIRIMSCDSSVNHHSSSKNDKQRKRKLSECEQDQPKSNNSTLVDISNLHSVSSRQEAGRNRSKKIREHKPRCHRSLLTSTRRKSLPLENIANCSTSSSNKLLSLVTLSPVQLGKRNKRGEGLLHVAAIKGKVEDAKWLLEKGANPNARDNAGWSPLHEACNHGHAAIVKMLLDYGAIIDLPGGLDHDTPLHDAIANGRLEVVKLLVQQGAPLTPRNKRGLTPLDIAVTETMMSALKAVGSPREKTSLVQTGSFKCVDWHQLQTPKVILHSGLKEEQKELLENCARALGGKVAKEFSPEVTHLVTATNDKDHCARTFKYLSALLCGKWVISFSWITDCMSVRSWVDESQHEVKGTAKGKEGVPHYSRVNAVKQFPSLFDGCQFYFSGAFNPPTPHKDNLIQLAKYGGGKVLTREPKAETDYGLFVPTKEDKKRVPLVDLPVVAYHANPESEQYRCTRYIIYDPLSQTQPTNRYESLSIGTVNWFLDCISNFEILDIPM